MESIAAVDLDTSGTFKCILIELTDKNTKQTRLIVRGYARCGYHADILDEVSPAIEKQQIKLNCLGGGRIQLRPTEKHIKIYGYSQGFGLADHAKSAELIRRTFPDYKVDWSNDGY